MKKSKAVETNDITKDVEEAYFNPQIPGLESLLKQLESPEEQRGFLYHKHQPFNMVMYGPSGVGKTTIALQMAFAAAKQGMQVIYLTKDTNSRVLCKRIKDTFHFFVPKKANNKDSIDWHELKDGELFPKNKWAKRVKNTLEDPKWRKVDFFFLESSAMHDILKNWEDLDIGDLEKIEDSRKLKDIHDSYLSQLMGKGVFAFVDFDEIPSNAGKLDRYALSHSVYDALGDLAPSLKPLFQKMSWLETASYFDLDIGISNIEIKERTERPENLFLVCDALSPPALEESLRLQNAKFQTAMDVNVMSRKAISLFVMESEVMPQSMTVSFPPDVQISLGMRQEAHDIQSRTIRLVKTRFQDSLSDRTTYMIRDASPAKQSNSDKPSNGNEDSSQRPGVEIFPPLSHEAARLTDRNPCAVKFGIEQLDDCTNPSGLVGGGCTLLVTDSRCGATPLSLHFILGQILEKQNTEKENMKPSVENPEGEESKGDLPHSVLYISFSDTPANIRTTIGQYSELKKTVQDEKTGNIPEWKTKGKQRFTLKLNRDDKCIKHSRFNVFIPEFQWLTPEAALAQVVKFLSEAAPCDKCNSGACSQCLRIDRVVLDRVSRLQACWPLVKDADIFISALVALCDKHKIGLMLIDDTATKEENTALFHSHWESMAQNIIRLRRVPFHGAETTTIEISSVGGSRNVVQKRPLELINHDKDGNMNVLDTFRGHTFLPTGEPVRCKVKVELCYDVDNTPLYHEVMSMKRSIEAAMDGVEVKVLGRGDWSGINSAFSNLTSGSRDTCHVVAIDGIGLQHLLTNDPAKQVLHSFSSDELEALLPQHLKEKLKGQPNTKQSSKKKEKQGAKAEENIEKSETLRLKAIKEAFYAQYVTRSSTIAMANLQNSSSSKEGLKENPNAYFAAIPMRHNWGVLAVSRLSQKYTEFIFKKFSPSKNNNLAPGKKQDNQTSKKWRQLYGLVESNLFDKLKQSNLSWKNIADFKAREWYSFWKDHPNFENTIAELLASKGPNQVDPWLLLFPRIDLFGLAMTSEESIVSFFLELLLAHFGYDALFEIKGQGTAILRFKKHQRAFEEVLYLFYRLLSPRQRRQLAIGVGAAHQAIGPGLADQLYGTRTGENPFQDWPRQICLLSREWITTISDLMPRYDIRESIEMFPLPVGNKAATQAWWKRLDLDQTECKDEYLQKWAEIENTGLPVAGTWYLGVLNGGNIDLAPDVMKPILSKEQEQERMLTLSGAPVSREVYGKHKLVFANKANGEELYDAKRSHRLPYGDVMRRVREPEVNQADGIPKVFFPFHRSQIQNYAQLSPILYDLVRNVMRLTLNENLETELLGDFPSKGMNHDIVELGNEIKRQVKRSFRRMRDINEFESSRTDAAS